MPILYGMPGSELIQDEEAGRVVLGGCVIEEENPNWACKGPIPHRWVGEESIEGSWALVDSYE